MPDYQIHIPTEAELSAVRLQTVRNPKLLALRGVQIGPAFSLPDPTRQLGLRGVTRKKTKSPLWVKVISKAEAEKLCITPSKKVVYRTKRRVRNKVAHQSRVRNQR